uniref:Uncharacterized protein n=1 Tax=Octopus bimaculoides TaxID=37653 RepID=A0A0L8HNE1_OCTBM
MKSCLYSTVCCFVMYHYFLRNQRQETLQFLRVKLIFLVKWFSQSINLNLSESFHSYYI